MSASRKLTGDSELAKFKELWRDKLKPSDRDYWRSRFLSRDTQSEIRAELKLKLKVNLLYDEQLTRFRKWDNQQQALDLEAEQQADDERRLKQEHPEWTKDQLRDELLLCTYRRAKASGDFKLGLAAMKQDRGFMDTILSREQFEFDAAKACLAHLPFLKSVAVRKDLSEAEKIQAVRQKLWGKPPAA